MDDRERLIALIYEGITNEEAWEQLLARLTDELNVADAGLGLQDMATHSLFRVVADAGIDRSLHDTYARLAPANRIWQAIGGERRPMADRLAMRKSELVSSPQELFSPQGFHGAMAAPVPAHETLSGVVVAFCGKRPGNFEGKDHDLLTGFAPHIGPAVALGLERERILADLHADRQILDETDEAIGLLDAGVQVIHTNAAPTAQLGRGEGLQARHHRLIDGHPDRDANLKDMLRPAPRIGGANGGTLDVVNNDFEGGSTLTVPGDCHGAGRADILFSEHRRVCCDLKHEPRRRAHQKRSRQPRPDLARLKRSLQAPKSQRVCELDHTKVARAGLAWNTIKAGLR
jgi:hypothetical protein